MRSAADATAAPLLAYCRQVNIDGDGGNSFVNSDRALLLRRSGSEASRHAQLYSHGRRYRGSIEQATRDTGSRQAVARARFIVETR